MGKRAVPYLVILFLFSAQSLDAQKWKMRRYEAMFGVGFNNYFGDVGGAATSENWFGLKDLSLKHTRPSFYLGARYKIRPNISVKANFMYGYIAGNDEGGKNNDRGFEFSTRLIEPSVQGEYSILSEEQRRRSGAMFNKKGMMNNYSQINVYLYAGIGGVFFHPKVNDVMASNPVYEPNHSTFGLVFPVGVGVKYVISERWSIGAEFGPRFTTTDYLDGYTSKFSKSNDLYYFGHIHGIYRIKTSRDGWPQIFPRRQRGFR